MPLLMSDSVVPYKIAMPARVKSRVAIIKGTSKWRKRFRKENIENIVKGISVNFTSVVYPNRRVHAEEREVQTSNTCSGGDPRYLGSITQN